MDADSEAPQNIRMVNMTFIGESTPDIRSKLQKLYVVFGINPSKLVDIAFKVLNSGEQRQNQDDQEITPLSWQQH